MDVLKLNSLRPATGTHTHVHTHTPHITLTLCWVQYVSPSHWLQRSFNFNSRLYFMSSGSRHVVNFLSAGLFATIENKRRLKKSSPLSSWHDFSASLRPLMCIPPSSSEFKLIHRPCVRVRVCVCVRACEGVCHVVFCVWMLYLQALCLCASVCAVSAAPGPPASQAFSLSVAPEQTY